MFPFRHFELASYVWLLALASFSVGVSVALLFTLPNLWTGLALLVALLLFGVAIYIGGGGANAEKPSGSIPSAHLPYKPEIVPRDELLNHLPDALLLLDEKGTILYGNSELEFLLGVKPQIGRPLSSAIRAPAVLESVHNILNGHTQNDQIEFQTRVPLSRDLLVLLRRLSNAKSQDTVLCLFRDVTEIKQAERLRSDFVANASHELRTPLTSILGFLETLRSPLPPSAKDHARFLEIMERQARHMRRLIEDLLSLTRIELSEHISPQETVNLRNIIQHAKDGLMLIAEAAGVALKIDLPETLPPIKGEPNQLLQVFQNLLENAIKYGGTLVEVTVEAAPLQGSHYLAVHVRDHGGGIDPQHIPRLTERFYRINTKESREKSGTGLGLAIVKHILNRHRGRLEISSQSGVGSCFTVLLPIAASPI